MKKKFVFRGTWRLCLITVILALLVSTACEQSEGGDTEPVITIIDQPIDTTVTAGAISGSLSVSATVTENAKPAYQWYSNTSASNAGGTKVAGATAASFTIPAALSEGVYYYFCEITSTGGAKLARSNAAKVTVNEEVSRIPVITVTAHPAASTEVTAGAITESLSVTATVTEGAAPVYQWYSNTAASNVGGTKVAGATTASFAIPAALSAGTYYYFCEVTATGGAVPVRSSAATVMVAAAGTPAIRIDTEPAQSTKVMEGAISVTLSVAASGINGAEVTGYQWYSNTSASNVGGTKVDGATYASFAIPTDLTPDTYYYFCEITASGGAAPKRSSAATVTVMPVPVITITAHPAANTTVTAGEISGSLSVTATVTENAVLSYQWWYSNTVIDGATTESFAIPSDLTEGIYQYFCEITASGGAVSKRTNVATVMVIKPTPAIRIDTQPAQNTTVKAGETGSLSVTASGRGDAVISGYQWYSNTTASTEGGTKIEGATTENYTIPDNLAVGDHFYFCEITATGVDAPVYSRVAKVTVSNLEIGIDIDLNEKQDLVPQTADAIAGTDKIFSAVGDWTFYQWYVNGTLRTSGYVNTYTFNQAAGDYTLTVVVTDSAGDKFSGSCRVTVK